MGPRPRSSRKKPTRTHQRGGCGVCRKRHLKCDLVRPACLTCRAVGATCDGYRTVLKWTSENDAEKPGQEAGGVATDLVRSHLYSEDSRASMSVALQSDLGWRPVDKTIAELDVNSRDSEPSSTQDIVMGPFAVFAMRAQDEPCALQDVPSAMDGGAGDPAFAPFDHPVSAPTNFSLETNFDTNDLLDWHDLFNLDSISPDSLSSFLDPSEGPPDSQNSNGLPDATVQPGAGGGSDPFKDGSLDTDQPQPAVNTPPMILNTTLQDHLDVTDAQLLLKCFKESVIPQMRPMPTNKKSSWEVLHLESAMVSLAHITYMSVQKLSNASLASMYAVLALAAGQWGLQRPTETSSRGRGWRLLAEQFYVKAKEHIKFSLRMEYQGTNAAKYKDQVMAITSLLNLSVLFDKQPEARSFMIDAERLLRQRGLAKRHMSRRARLLHHTYTWHRILDESTYVHRCQCSANVPLSTLSPSSTRQRDREAAVDYSRLDDFLRLEPEWPQSIGGPAGMAQKDNESGLRDIHLQDSREWGGFFPQLYGVSEMWLSLLSQATRLANFVDGINTSKQTATAETLLAMQKRLSHLEDKICAFATPTFGNTDSSANRPSVSMVRALNAALVIFFYRRVKDVNAWILQTHVGEVARALQDFTTCCENNGFDGTGWPWPAFMAGCEALREDQRDYFRGWFEKAVLKTAFPRFSAAKSCMEEVWKRRDNDSQQQTRHAIGEGRTWVSLCYETNSHILLS